MDEPELSHIIKISDIGDPPLTGSIIANGQQRLALASRFNLSEIRSLRADYSLQERGKRFVCTGSIIANLSQACVISGHDVPVKLEENFKIVFIKKADFPSGDGEVELASEDCDHVEYEGTQIDLGETVAQTLYLALDPYPRSADADNIAQKKGLLSEGEAGPFGALAELKHKLG